MTPNKKSIILGTAFALVTGTASAISRQNIADDFLSSGDEPPLAHRVLAGLDRRQDHSSASINDVGDFVAYLHYTEQTGLADDQITYQLPPKDAAQLKKEVKRTINDLRAKEAKCAFIIAGYVPEPGTMGRASFSQIALGFPEKTGDVYIFNNYSTTNSRDLLGKELLEDSVDPSYLLIQEVMDEYKLKIDAAAIPVYEEQQCRANGLLPSSPHNPLAYRP
jgi:hypothetical protein